MTEQEKNVVKRIYEHLHEIFSIRKNIEMKDVTKIERSYREGYFDGFEICLKNLKSWYLPQSNSEEETHGS